MNHKRQILPFDTKKKNVTTWLLSKQGHVHSRLDSIRTQTHPSSNLIEDIDRPAGGSFT